MKARGVARDELGQIGRGPEDAGEELVDLGLGDECAERREAGVLTAPAGQIGKHVCRAFAIVHDGGGDDALVEGGVGQCEPARLSGGYRTLRRMAQAAQAPFNVLPKERTAEFTYYVWRGSNAARRAAISSSHSITGSNGPLHNTALQPKY